MCSDWNHPTSELKEISLSDKSHHCRARANRRLKIFNKYSARPGCGGMESRNEKSASVLFFEGLPHDGFREKKLVRSRE